jgi:hypothetical protein
MWVRFSGLLRRVVSQVSATFRTNHFHGFTYKIIRRQNPKNYNPKLYFLFRSFKIWPDKILGTVRHSLMRVSIDGTEANTL